jgi:hypothetical protein
MSFHHGLHRVTFTFRTETDVREVSELPEIGDFVTHGDELWIVHKVEPNDLGAVVICEQSRPHSA